MDRGGHDAGLGRGDGEFAAHDGGGAPFRSSAVAPDERTSAVLQAALRVALEAIPHPAAVVAEQGEVRFANEAGRRALARHGRAIFVGAAATGPDGCKVVLFPGPRTDTGQRAARWRARYGLSERQAEVLGLAAQGLSNATIAGHLGCSVRTVEVHMSAIFDCAGIGSRAALAARFWREE